MSYDAKILADSMSPAGVRLTSLQITFPRFELPAFNTHRAFARNSASSRAIPVDKQIQRVLADPYVPEAFGKNQRGMQSEQDLLDQDGARQDWLLARDSAVFHARAQMGRETHKQIANRLLEPFMFHTVIVTATDFGNFFALRMHKDAQAEIRKVACMMYEVMGASSPISLKEGEWHLPLVQGIDASDIVLSYDIHHAAQISAGRCARVSYLTHDGRRDLSADLGIVEKLGIAGHMSPFEHPARPATLEDAAEQAARLGIHGATSYDLTKVPFGNLRGWCSLRWSMPNEAVFGGGER